MIEKNVVWYNGSKRGNKVFQKIIRLLSSYNNNERLELK